MFDPAAAPTIVATDWRRHLHPASVSWLQNDLGQPTEVQRRGWDSIATGADTLIAAPTGSGKTLAAFLLMVDKLVRQALAGELEQQCQLLYVSPLKALSNDIDKNLQQPLRGINAELERLGLGPVSISSFVRTGDTTMAERARAARRSPHIVVTTPESLYIMLTSASGRNTLASVRWLIVDEVHALLSNKRGAHLALSLERLQHLVQSNGRSRPQRIGLSATQKPMQAVADFLTGGQSASCNLVNLGHQRAWDLQLELPRTELSALLDQEVWGEIYDRLAELAREHRTTLVFVNTRRLAERAARHLSERLSADLVATHHGSLSREHRLRAEQRLKNGELRLLIATASLELGLDIGEIDLVCQIASPRRINTFLQRVGRSGHKHDQTPKGRLFPISRDDLLECSALLQAVRAGELDSLLLPEAPLDVLAQQLVALVACEQWQEDELYALVRRAFYYRELERADFDTILGMLAEGYNTRRGRRNAYIYRDAINKQLRARRGARLTAITNAGTIPDNFDSLVILEPAGVVIGSVSEDFAFESLAGNIFQLGNATYRILKSESGALRVEDAGNQPPNIPFWFGEAPARSDELSAAVARLRSAYDQHGKLPELDGPALEQLEHYLAISKAALGVLPSLDTIVFERFFDEVGDMHLVLHSVYGARINRAWGLALRKRFCRNFNFELQASASEECIVLSLGPTHSFELAEVANYLSARSAREVLIQALLDSPIFATRWRWVGSVALALPRQRGGKRLAPQLQRMNAEDLIALVFPDQLACLENIVGEREIPDHPLIAQTISDCLHEVMDVDGFLQLLDQLASGAVRVVCRDLTEASPMAQEILQARPYQFLDDGEAEERRTQAVKARRFITTEDAARLSSLDLNAIDSVKAQAWPQALDADDLHDALMVVGALLLDELSPAQSQLLEALIKAGRARKLLQPPCCCAQERWTQWQALQSQPESSEAEEALLELTRGYLSVSGPVTAASIAARLRVTPSGVQQALLKLEGEGLALRGSFDPRLAASEQWCDRVLLARIHRLSVNRLRAQVEAVSKQDFLSFLIRWHQLDQPGAGATSLSARLQQLEGYAAPASLWEASLLAARVQDYSSIDLDQLCAGGRFIWCRRPQPGGTGGTLKNAPVYILPRAQAGYWLPPQADWPQRLSASAQRVLEWLEANGASFFADIVDASRLLPSQAEAVLAELAAAGLVNSDSFAGLRALISSDNSRQARWRKLQGVHRFEHAGRWQALRYRQVPDDQRAERVAWVLLQRYGVVFRALLSLETAPMPKWRELAYNYRRLEARGELRGGYFVAGVSGEQYALPEVLPLLRQVRFDAPEPVRVSSFDPLNLSGALSAQRHPAQVRTQLVVPTDFS